MPNEVGANRKVEMMLFLVQLVRDVLGSVLQYFLNRWKLHVALFAVGILVLANSGMNGYVIAIGVSLVVLAILAGLRRLAVKAEADPYPN